MFIIKIFGKCQEIFETKFILSPLTSGLFIHKQKQVYKLLRRCTESAILEF